MKESYEVRPSQSLWPRVMRGAGWAFAFPIQDDEHFFEMMRYVDRNALAAGAQPR